jgi:hypothetical protein
MLVYSGRQRNDILEDQPERRQRLEPSKQLGSRINARG